jgi:hypothetical protein
MSDFTHRLHELVGASIDSPDVRAFLAKLAPSAQVFDADGEPRWLSHEAGLEVHGEPSTRRITTVILFPEGVDGYHAYAGPLPGGVTFAMSRDQLRTHLGRAPDISGERHDKWEHDTYGFIVQYKKSGPIRDISLTGY